MAGVLHRPLPYHTSHVLLRIYWHYSVSSRKVTCGTDNFPLVIYSQMQAFRSLCNCQKNLDEQSRLYKALKKHSDGHAFIILQYEFGLPRAFVLTSTTEISESDASVSPFSPKLVELSSSSTITL